MRDGAHTHPKSPVSIYCDNEIDYIDEKHEGVHVTHRTIFWVDDVVEKLSYGQINVKGTVEERKCQKTLFLKLSESQIH